jgi:hypothetical protein
MPSTCSFCFGDGHNIRNCNSETIGRRWRNIIYKVINAPHSEELFTQQHIENAKIVLRIIPSDLLRCVSTRFCGGKMRDVKMVAISRILIKIEEKYEEWRVNGELPIEIESPRFIRYRNTIVDSQQEQEESIQEESRSNNIQLNLLILPYSDDGNINVDCPICFDDHPTLSMISTTCNHDFCTSCISKYLIQTQKHCCPLCRADIKTLWAKDVECYEQIREIFNH